MASGATQEEEAAQAQAWHKALNVLLLCASREDQMAPLPPLTTTETEWCISVRTAALKQLQRGLIFLLATHHSRTQFSILCIITFQPNG